MQKDVEFYGIYSFYEKELINCLKIDVSMRVANIFKF